MYYRIEMHFIHGYSGAKENGEAEALVWSPWFEEVAMPRGEDVGQGLPPPQPQQE